MNLLNWLVNSGMLNLLGLTMGRKKFENTPRFQNARAAKPPGVRRHFQRPFLGIERSMNLSNNPPRWRVFHLLSGLRVIRVVHADHFG